MMNEEYTQLDINPMPRWGFSRYPKNKKDKKKTVIRFNTPIQPINPMRNGGIPEGYMLNAPIAKIKDKKRYS